jgi:hypothetical protein|tara:strand:+ start:1650 stop:1844 length:195 start_codon:yes stop_codon:yes gene_type:complete
MEKRKNRQYVASVILRNKGKVYGGTTRQVNAKNVAQVRRILKKRFKFKGNKVTVPKIKLKKDWK